MKQIQHLILAGLIALAQPLTLQAEEGHAHDEKAGAQNASAHGADEGKDEHGAEEGAHEEEGGVQLTAAQRQAAGIQVVTLQPQRVNSAILVPGEVTLNDYASSKVTPRISAQVVQRHARLGDKVTSGQALVTLSSVEMAQAQGDLLVAEREWRRVSKLGRKVVSGARYTEARVNREQARARVLAYGMSNDQLNALIDSGKADQANGQFQLISTQKGTVIRDHFIIGELIEPGRVLFEISDESLLWVEARMTPGQSAKVRANAAASIRFGKQQFTGRVTQIHHALDESTRTLGIRIEVANPDDILHPGLFVDARIETSGTESALAVPNDAILRSPDGDWVVFVEHENNQFEPQEVEIIRSSGEQTIIEGLTAGTRVVTAGAFFLQSELAKAGFNIHNH